MKFKLISVAATAFLMAAPPAYAANWIRATVSINNTIFYYDLDSIQRSGNQITVWEKMDHSRDKTIKRRETKSRYRYDCAERTVTILNVNSYFPDGKIDVLTVETYAQKTVSIPPETVFEAMLEAVCAASAP